MAPMMFAHNMTYHKSIKSTPFEVTFCLQPQTAENPNPDFKRLYEEDLGTNMFQRLRNSQNLASKIMTNPLKS
jgi:hypothetical protein